MSDIRAIVTRTVGPPRETQTWPAVSRAELEKEAESKQALRQVSMVGRTRWPRSPRWCGPELPCVSKIVRGWGAAPEQFGLARKLHSPKKARMFELGIWLFMLRPCGRLPRCGESEMVLDSETRNMPVGWKCG